MGARAAELRGWLREALEFLEKGDVVQSSEKLYKLATLRAFSELLSAKNKQLF